MLLTLDISNTSIKAGVFRGDELLANWRIATERHKLTDDYGMLLLNLLQASGMPASEIDGVSMSCVVPPLRSVFEELARKYLHRAPVIVGPGIKTGVKLAVDNPREVGADRMVNSLATCRLYAGPASGALNESYSDIWGEVVDMLNGVGTDSPAGERTVNACTTHTPPVPQLTINSPAAIAGTYAAGAAQFGPPLTAAGLTGNVVLGDDGVAPGSDACTALTNGAAIAGNIALVDRGACAFTIKVKNAQNARAIGVIVADNVAGPVAGMAGSDATIVIPSLHALPSPLAT